MATNKTPFTEKEIEELCDFYHNVGLQHGLTKLLQYIQEKHNLSNANAIVVDSRIFINDLVKEFNDKRDTDYPNSTLQSKLMTRLDESESESKSDSK